MMSIAAAGCTQLDHLCFFGCRDCTQEGLEAAMANVTTITGAVPNNLVNPSICLVSTSGIRSLAMLKGVVKGVMPGGILIQKSNKLLNLDGLEGITEFVQRPYGKFMITITSNALLASVMALGKAKLNPARKLHIHSNFQMCAVPAKWGELDGFNSVMTYQFPCNQCSAANLGLDMVLLPFPLSMGKYLRMPCINSEAGLRRIADAKCNSADYVCVSNCSDCTQSSFEAAFENVQNLSGFGVPVESHNFGKAWSIMLTTSPGITSLKPLRRIRSLMGGVFIHKMDGLSDLQGLEKIEVVSTGIDFNNYPADASMVPFALTQLSLSITGNPNLKSARAFENVHVWGKVDMHDNPSLCDLPPQFRNHVGDEIANNGVSCVQAKHRSNLSWLVVAVGIVTVFVLLSFVMYSSKGTRAKHEELKHEEQDEKQSPLLGTMEPDMRFISSSPYESDADREEGMVPMNEVQFLDFISDGSFGRVYRVRWKGGIIAAKTIDLSALSRSAELEADSTDLSDESTDLSDERTELSDERTSTYWEAQLFGRFRREVQILSAVRHHNIVSYVGFGRALDNTTGSMLAILLMEYVEGGTLLDFLREWNWDKVKGKKGGMGERDSDDETGSGDLDTERGWDSNGGSSDDGFDPDRYNLAMQMTCGIEHLHELHIIHRDIKPNNVLLNDTHTLAKIADFGLAISMPANAPANQKHMPSAMGNVMYVAPEVMLGKPSSQTVDVYALGLVIWQIFSGQRLVRQTALDLILAVIDPGREIGSSNSTSKSKTDCKLPKSLPPNALRSIANGHLRALLLRCWHQEPDNRPTCTEIGRQLRLAMESPRK
jgi:serine/threonine protein kinase